MFKLLLSSFKLSYKYSIQMKVCLIVVKYVRGRCARVHQDYRSGHIMLSPGNSVRGGFTTPLRLRSWYTIKKYKIVWICPMGKQVELAMRRAHSRKIELTADWAERFSKCSKQTKSFTIWAVESVITRFCKLQNIIEYIGICLITFLKTRVPLLEHVCK